MTPPLRVGIVGASPTRGWALGTHIPALKALEGFELAAVATTRIETAHATAEAFGVPKAYTSAGALIADPDIDIVTVSVKVPHHYEIVRSAIEAGKHVYCEWPLGRTTAEATELALLAERRGVRTVIGLQGRRSPIVQYVRALIAEGAIGEPYYARLSVEVPGGRQISEDRIWAADRTNGVHALSILGGHNLDVLRWVLGELDEITATVAVRSPTVTVAETGAEIEVTSPDVVLLTARIGAGAYASVAIQSGLPRGFGVGLEIQGSEGVLVIEGAISLNLSDSAMSLSGALHGGDLGPLVVPDEFLSVPGSVPEGNARNVAALYQTLADAIGGATVDPDFATAVELHHLIDAIETSASSGARTSP